MASEERTLTSKAIPYVLYVLVLTSAMIHEWSGNRDPQAVSWRKFVAKNKHALVTNVIVDPHAVTLPRAFLAVEIVGSGNGEKRAISSETSNIVKLSFVPEVGEELTFAIRNGHVLVTRARDDAKPE